MERGTARVAKRVVLVIFAIFLLSLPRLLTSGEWREIASSPKFQVFSLVLLSILFEALPFILLGSLISGLIEVCVSRDRLSRLIPSSKPLGIVSGAILGMVFPVCECGVIPVVRRLLKKGVPIHIAITYMLAAPIINPIVIASTFMAFRDEPKVLFGRIILGFFIAIGAGFLVSRLGNKRELVKDNSETTEAVEHCGCPHGPERGEGLFRKIEEVFEHTITEFFIMGKYLIFGSVLAALIQTFVSRPALIAIGGTQLTAILVMMALAVVLSLCSEADAFVARSFTHFTAASKLSFLVLGPMFDIKLFFMFLGCFRKKLLLPLISYVLLAVFLATLLLGRL